MPICSIPRPQVYFSVPGITFNTGRLSSPSVVTSQTPMHELDEQLRELIPRLRRFAVSLTRHASSADDLVQSTLERAIISWADKRIEGDLRAWLFSILYRQFLDAHRRSRRYARMLEFFTGRDDTQPSVERTVMAQSTLQAFDKLNTEQRALLLWVSVEGLSYKQVADILEVPIGTVMSRLSRARQALRQLSDGEIASPSLRILK
ncbi:RNA polymerase sigma-70 factor, ECF subfamily [Pseudomonas costantinii]|uniref:RNA polymerase sigma-70 factor, ECF subfamily n=2 Tax=Pseudomonas costantinii TaxID=168469 RepID=A0A1H5AND9_9PSED|nr:RNA polymerase sigma-70 factor, ECF subfamily [Pseudomonas costantinii]